MWACGVSADEFSCAHGVQINFGDLTSYLTYAKNRPKESQITAKNKQILKIWNLVKPISKTFESSVHKANESCRNCMNKL
jgi:hypothetical protein